MMNKKILILGAGYVGLTLAAVLLKKKIKLTILDNNKKIIHNLKNEEVHIFEPDLKKIIKKSIENKIIKFESKIINKKFDIIINCIGTPIDRQKKIINKNVISSCKEIKNFLKPKSLVILRSTFKIGTTKNIFKKILDKKNIQYYLAYCPERTIEGNAIKELEKLPQIISAEDEISKKKAINFFRKFNKNKIILFNNFESGEFSKLIGNSFRDTFFSISNEIAEIAEKLNLNAHEIIDKSNYRYPRTNLALAGPVGGPCLVKDTYILSQSIKNYKPKIILNARNVNKNLIKNTILKLNNFIKKKNNKKKKIKISIIGLSFKGFPKTNDIRYSTAIEIVKSIKSKYSNVDIYVYDDCVEKNKIIKLGLKKISKVSEIFFGTDICIIHNINNKIKNIKYSNYIDTMSNKSLIFSMWNIKSLNNIVSKKARIYMIGTKFYK